MTDHGSDDEPDLWANTGNQPSLPSEPAPTTAQPAVPPPTAVQPTTPGPLNTPAAGAAPAGYVTGPGAPPPAQPPAPPTGPGGPGGPGGPTEPESGPPAWLIPAAIGALVAVVGAGLIYFITRDDGDDIVSTDVSTTVSIAPDTTIVEETTTVPETTIAPETTLAPTTLPPSTDPPATDPPATDPPATDPPATDPPATDPPEGIQPAQPGQALVAGDALDIVSGCTTSPVPGYGVRSFLVMDAAGPLIIEEGNDEGNAFGFFSDAGNPADTVEYTELGDGFGMLVLEGDTSFEVAVNPEGVDVSDCGSRGTARLSDPASPEFGYNYGIVDACGTEDRTIAYLSEGGNIRIADNGDGTAQVTLNTLDLFDATDSAASLVDDGGRLTLTGEVTGSTIDGETTQAIELSLDSASVRACAAGESP